MYLEDVCIITPLFPHDMVDIYDELRNDDEIIIVNDIKNFKTL